MKKAIVLLIVALFPMLACAAPFGLKMGMSLKDIAKECEGKPELIKDDKYLIKPKKNHPLFVSYIAFVDKKKGLYQIRALTTSIASNEYGTEIRAAFDDAAARISKTYGEPQIRDEVDPNTSFHEDKYWIYTLKEGARTLSALWNNPESMKDSLDSVYLECLPEKFSKKAFLVLYYYFKNSDKIEDEQDSVF